MKRSSNNNCCVDHEDRQDDVGRERTTRQPSQDDAANVTFVESKRNHEGDAERDARECSPQQGVAELRSWDHPKREAASPRFDLIQVQKRPFEPDMPLRRRMDRSRHNCKSRRP